EDDARTIHSELCARACEPARRGSRPRARRGYSESSRSRRGRPAGRHHRPFCSGSRCELIKAMARKQTRRTAALAFDAITVEGALLAPAILARIAQHQVDGQSEADYGVPKGLTLREEIARYFR